MLRSIPAGDTQIWVSGVAPLSSASLCSHKKNLTFPSPVTSDIGKAEVTGHMMSSILDNQVVAEPTANFDSARETKLHSSS